MGNLFDATQLDFRSGRSFGAKGLDETRRFVFVSGVDFDDDSARGVERDTRQAETVGKFLDERAEADALNDSFEDDAVSRKVSAGSENQASFKSFSALRR